MEDASVAAVGKIKTADPTLPKNLSFFSGESSSSSDVRKKKNRAKIRPDRPREVFSAFL